MGSVGLQFKTYRYYSAEKKGLDFEAMLADLEAAQAGDVVLYTAVVITPVVSTQRPHNGAFWLT